MSHVKDFEDLVAMEHAIRALAQVRENRHGQVDAFSNRGEITSSLTTVFLRAYDENCSDSSQFAKPQKDGVYFGVDELPEASKARLQEIMREFVDHAYDENGAVVITREQAPQTLQTLYEQLKEIPLNHVEYAAGVLLQHLGVSEKWHEALPQGVDFTRAHHGSPLEQRFVEALHNGAHHTHTSQFITHSESVDVVAGHEFPSMERENWRTHYVTENGYLVDRTDEFKARLESYLNNGGHIGDFTVAVTDDNDHLSQLVKAPRGADVATRERIGSISSRLEEMRHADEVDGKKVDMTMQPLFCMDTDLLTGLYIKSHAAGEPSEMSRFKALAKKSGVIAADAMGMSDMLGFMPDEAHRANQTPETIRDCIREKFVRLREAAGDDRGMQNILARAERNMINIAPRVWESVEKAFTKEDGSPKRPPAERHGSATEKHFYMSQGGMGSGKSYAEEMAKTECGDDLIVAGLDAVRSESQQYDLFLGTDNHNNDYKKLEEFGKLIRAMTIRRAMHDGHDLLLDGTGIPYRSRYKQVVGNFKEEGYRTAVLAADVPLYVDDAEKRAFLALSGKTFDDALFRGGSRLTRTGRAVPLSAVSDSHMRAPEAIMNAARDENVDCFRLMDTAPALGKSYTLSYVVEVNDEQINLLRQTPANKMYEVLKGQHLIPDDVTVPEATDQFDFKIVRNLGEGHYRMQVVTDMERYLGVVQKGLYDRDVITNLQKGDYTGPEDYTRNTLSFDVEGSFQNERGKLRTVPAKGVQEVQWPQYTRAIG